MFSMLAVTKVSKWRSGLRTSRSEPHERLHKTKTSQQLLMIIIKLKNLLVILLSLKEREF